MRGRWLLIAGLLGSSAACNRRSEGVVLITLDTVRADHVSCYGYSQRTTPFIDSLARDGTLFERAITAAPTTPVSHASILTGLYPPRNGVRFIHGFVEHMLDPHVATMAGSFSGAGYDTAAFISAFPLKGSRYGLNRDFGYYDESFLNGRPDPVGRKGFVVTGDSQRRAGETFAAFRRWFEKKRPRKFFVWIHLFDAHDRRMLPPADFKDRYLSGNPGAPLRDRKDVYDYEISYMDEQLSQALSRLRKECSTLRVAIVSDHGEGLGDHNYGAHGDRLWQEQIRVPLVLWGSGVPAGRRVAGTVSTADILPTLLLLAGLRPPEGIDGRDLLSETGNRTCYSETLNPMIKGGPAIFAMAEGDRKIIHCPQEGTTQCYDLAEDPRELRDVAPATGTFTTLLEQLRPRIRVPAADGAGEQMDDATHEKLKSLGYVD